jgi:hypothetical protein
MHHDNDAARKDQEQSEYAQRPDNVETDERICIEREGKESAPDSMQRGGEKRTSAQQHDYEYVLVVKQNKLDDNNMSKMAPGQFSERWEVEMGCF